MRFAYSFRGYNINVYHFNSKTEVKKITFWNNLERIDGTIVYASTISVLTDLCP